MGNAQEILDMMMSRLERAIAMGSGQGAMKSKDELGGALELAMDADLISPEEYANRTNRMIDAFYDAVDAGRLEFGS